MTEQPSVAEMFLDVAVDFEKKTQDQEKFAHKIAQKTKWVIRVSVVFLAAFTLITAFSIYTLAEILEESVAHMETMYQNFSMLSEEMSTMTTSVTGMEQNVSDVRTIAGVVSSMGKSVAEIEQDMISMDKTILLFNQDVQRMQQDMGAMHVIFGSVNQSMSRMRYDVDEISRTARLIPTP